MFKNCIWLIVNYIELEEKACYNMTNKLKETETYSEKKGVVND